MLEETNTNPTPPAPEPPTLPTPPEPVVAPVAPAEPIQTPPVAAPEPAPAPTAPPSPAPAMPDVRSLLAKALAKIQFRKQAKLEKIMVLAKSRGQVANDDVQKLLRVSDATATRYLAQLAKAGRLWRAGIRGGAVYRLVQ